MNILQHTFASLKPGNPLDKETSLAPMNSQKAADKLAAQIKKELNMEQKLPINIPKLKVLVLSSVR